jgi:hypothetical protein
VQVRRVVAHGALRPVVAALVAVIALSGARRSFGALSFVKSAAYPVKPTWAF